MIPPSSPLDSRHDRRGAALVFDHRDRAVRAIATEIAALIRERARTGHACVLGLATGSTPRGLYAELVRLHREEALSFANVTTFNLDEYYPLAPTHALSYRSYMHAELFAHVDLDPARTHLPSGTVAEADVVAHCADYEAKIRAAGGIDLQILGLGGNGHIGFNEPGSSRDSCTRMVTLAPGTRGAAAADWGDTTPPRYALTMGVRTILDARRIVLLAWGEGKADMVSAAVEGAVTAQVPASFLQEHPQAQFVLDAAAASALTRPSAGSGEPSG